VKTSSNSIESRNNGVPIRAYEDGRNELFLLLERAFLNLKRFGKTRDDLEAMNKWFQLGLADYSIDNIRSAFVKFCTSGTTKGVLPEVGDIIRIIKTGIVTIDNVVMATISKKDPADRTMEEELYLSRCVKYVTEESMANDIDYLSEIMPELLGGDFLVISNSYKYNKSYFVIGRDVYRRSAQDHYSAFRSEKLKKDSIYTSEVLLGDWDKQCFELNNRMEFRERTQQCEKELIYSCRTYTTQMQQTTFQIAS
jgi:hypothetical protein